jgi:hypothetical protein
LGSNVSDDFVGVIGQQVEVFARESRIGKQAERSAAAALLARLDVLRGSRGDQRPQPQPGRGVRLGGRAGFREPFQSRRQRFGCDQRIFVGVPRIVGEHAPVVGRERRAAGAGRQGGGERLLDRARSVHAHRQHPHVLIDLDLARQARDLAAIGREQDHRRIAADLETVAESLRAGAIAVDVHRHEKAGALDEILTVEDRRLDLIAGRTPHGSPVEEHRLVLRLRRREGRVDIAFCQAIPRPDAGPRSKRSRAQPHCRATASARLGARRSGDRAASSTRSAPRVRQQLQRFVCG